MGVEVAGFAPGDELGHVYTSVGRLAIVDPGLRLAEELSEFTLRQPGILSHRAENGRHHSVMTSMLGLREHAVLSRGTSLTRVPYQNMMGIKDDRPWADAQIMKGTRSLPFDRSQFGERRSCGQQLVC